MKTAVLQLLSADPFNADGSRNPNALRMSDELPEEWFDQVAGEVRRIRYVRNRAIVEFVPKKRGQRLECLDSLCYAWAVRQCSAVQAIDMRGRAARQPVPPGQPQAPAPKSKIASWAAHFNSD